MIIIIIIIIIIRIFHFYANFMDILKPLAQFFFSFGAFSQHFDFFLNSEMERAA